MKTLVGIKKDMEFNKGLAQLIETLKSIAIAHYYAMEKRLHVFEEFLPTVEKIFELIDIDAVRHPFLSPRETKQAIVAITTDTGFLGGLNMKVVQVALDEGKKMPTTIIVIGERGKMYVRGSGHNMVSFPGIKDEERRGQAWQLRDYIMEKALAGEFDTVKVVYPRAISFGVQRIMMVPFLPFKPDTGKKAAGTRIPEMILESRQSDIIEYLIYLWMGEQIFNIFGLSRLAEFSARYVHLDESEEKLKEEQKKVQLEYFRVRHELADRALRELISGRSVREKKH